jgi:hypothetical protein
MEEKDGLVNMVRLLGAMANGPSNAGNRKDNKICTAQAGECRFNSKYYTVGMRDAKSWDMPAADETCPDRCPYLGQEDRDLGSSEERQKRVGDLIGGIERKRATDELSAMMLLAMLGVEENE